MTFLKQHLLWLLLLLVTNAHATTHYVKHNASGSNNGTSWTDAFTDLQDAINAATVGDTVWVAAGTYKPSQHVPGSSTFSTHQTYYLNKDISIYGGFAGTETALSQRNFNANPTILSGDIGVLNDNLDNCYHLLITSGLTAAAVIDGFIIRDGNAMGHFTSYITFNNTNFRNNKGGGVYNDASSPRLQNLQLISNSASDPAGGGGGMLNINSSNPTLTNVSFIENSNSGLMNYNSSPSITDCLFESNQSSGMRNYHFSSPTLTNVLFLNNEGYDGGGIYNNTNWSTATMSLTNVSFIGNTSTNSGGGLYTSGAAMTLTNVSFTNNISLSGGGLYNDNPYSNTVIIQNSIFWDNFAIDNPEIFHSANIQTFYNCIIEGSGGSSTWNSDFGVDGGNNLDTNPLFYAIDDVRTVVGSPAIDMGDNSFNTTTSDINGNVRIQNGTIDIGAVEGTLPVPVAQRYYVNQSASGNNDGTTWADAFTDLQDAINVATQWDEIWVAAGTYKPEQYPPFDAYSFTARDKAFYLVENLKIYGGFSGTETQLTQRNISANPTILSGDIGVLNDSTDNCYHILITIGLSNTATVDGFTIKDANADVTTNYTYRQNIFERSHGGGISNAYSSLTLKNLIFDKNTAQLSGGGIFNHGSYPIMEDISFINNTAEEGGGVNNYNSSPVMNNINFTNNLAKNNGGGMYNDNASNVILTNVSFTNNSVENNGVTITLGGGIYNNNSSPNLENVSFTNNHALSNATWGSYGGAMYNKNSSPLLVNVTFTNNFADYGGAMRNTSSSSPTLINVIFGDNFASVNGGGIFNSFTSSPVITNATFYNNTTNSTLGGGDVFNNETSSPSINNSIIWGNTNGVFNSSNSSFNFTNCLVEGSGGSSSWNTNYGVDSGNNLDVNPLFQSATNVSLQANSPAIDVGDNSFNAIATDLAGNSRINNSIIDLGAYEYYSCLPVLSFISDTIYQDEIYTVGTSSYNTTGNYTDTLQTWQSCDSIITLNLLVLPVTYIIDTLVLGENYLDYYCFNVSPMASTDTLMNVVSTLTPNNCLTFYGDNLGTDSTYYYTNSEKVYFYLTVENGVWPGDTDDDALVNNNDLLNIGLAYGTNGIQRDSQTIQWNGYLATDWGTAFTNGLDYKHADADGNGIVNAADTLAIIQNWGLTYNKNGGNTGSPIYLAMDSLSIQNDLVSIPVVVGTAQEPLTDLYGVVFSISYDNKIVQANSMNLVLDNNTWFGNTADMLTVEKEFSSNEVFEYGITRINQTAISGHGQIGHLNFTLNPNALQGTDSLFTFEVFNVIANDHIGTTIPMQGIVDDINLDTIVQLISSTQNIEKATNLRLYPNPIMTQLTIEVESELITEISILDINGKQIKNALCRTHTKTIDLNEIPNGIYFVRVTTDKGVYTSKILKQ